MQPPSGASVAGPLGVYFERPDFYSRIALRGCWCRKMEMNTKRFLLVAVFATAGAICSIGLAAPVTVVQWTFEGDVSTPSTGSGTASLIGGTTATFAAGNSGGRGWNTSSYRPQGTDSGTAGVQFLFSTSGVQDVTLSFDHRSSGTGSRWAQVDYTLDAGANWVTGFWDNGGGLSPHDTFYTFNVDFTSVSAANNNPNFGVRIVSIFSPLAFDQNATLADFAAGTAYMRANSQASFTPGGGVGTGDYGTGGTWRFDNVTVTAVPEPSSLAVLGLIGGCGAYRARHKLIRKRK